MPGGNLKMLFAAVVVIIAALFWTLVNMYPFFYVLNWLGLMRVSEKEELAGLDDAFHAGPAYDHQEGCGCEDAVFSLEKRCAPLFRTGTFSTHLLCPKASPVGGSTHVAHVLHVLSLHTSSNGALGRADRESVLQCG